MHCFQEEITETSDPPLEHQSHLQALFGSQQLTNLKPGCMTGSSFCPQPLLLGGELNIKHFISQKSLPEGCEQPGHCPLQDPSDQPCSEENRAQRRNLRREQKDAFQLETEDSQLEVPYF